MNNHNIVPKENRPVLGIITGHWLSLVGSCVVTIAALCWLLALPSQLRGHVTNPYIGILLFVALPMAFVAGLILIPNWRLPIPAHIERPICRGID
jgi:hypothetical protein